MSELREYTIRLNGCDDCTEVQLTLTESEVEFLDMVATAIEYASNYSCQPTMSVSDGGE